MDRQTREGGGGREGRERREKMKRGTKEYEESRGRKNIHTYVGRTDTRTRSVTSVYLDRKCVRIG